MFFNYTKQVHTMGVFGMEENVFHGKCFPRKCFPGKQVDFGLIFSCLVGE